MKSIQTTYAQHFKALLDDAILNVLGNLKFTYDIHLEHYIRRKSDPVDVDITLVFFSGQIQLDVVQYPVQLVASVNEEFEEDFKNVLLYIAMNRNTKIFDFDGDSYREYYDTPSVLEKFQDNGSGGFRTPTMMNIQLLTYNNVADIDSIELSTTLNGVTYKEDVKFLSVALNYAAETNSTGALMTPMVSQCASSSTTAINLTFIPTKDRAIENVEGTKLGIFRALLKMVTSNTIPNQKWHLKASFKFDENDIELLEYDCILSNIDISREDGGFPICRVQIGRRTV